MRSLAQEMQTVLREPLCIRVSGGRFDFPRHASFAAIKIVMWWEAEFFVAFRRPSGLSSTGQGSAGQVDDDAALGARPKPSEFILLVIETAEALLGDGHSRLFLFILIRSILRYVLRLIEKKMQYFYGLNILRLAIAYENSSWLHIYCFPEKLDDCVNITINFFEQSSSKYPIFLRKAFLWYRGWWETPNNYICSRKNCMTESCLRANSYYI